MEKLNKQDESFLAELLAKDPTTLTPPEVNFLSEHEAYIPKVTGYDAASEEPVVGKVETVDAKPKAKTKKSK